MSVLIRYRLFLAALPALLLAGCSATPSIDTRYQAKSQDSRVQYVVLHYTSSGFERSLFTLTQRDVSSHYLISDGEPVIYQLVDENRRAWHAGDSSWQGRTWLNASSIGIELVQPGYTDTATCRQWHPWQQAQIDALIGLLKDIQQRHQLPPDAFIGHSDVAPQRKVDPGPLFPWAQLEAAGLATRVDPQRTDVMRHWLMGRTPSVAWFQQGLQRWGYAVPTHGSLDDATRNVIAAFQMRFRQARFDGLPDSETAALLAALVPEQGSALLNEPAPKWYQPDQAQLSPRLPPCVAAD